jgi:hypothetical protein
MFKHAQLETVKAWIIDPANGSLPLHERIQRAIRTLILEGYYLTVRPFLLHALWRLLSAFPGIPLKRPTPACMPKVLLRDKQAEGASSLPARVFKTPSSTASANR